MAALENEVAAEEESRIGPWITESGSSSPLYTAGPLEPTVPVQLNTGAWGAPLQAVFSEGVPIPPDAQPASGSDGQMTIYQPSTNTLWEFWQAVKSSEGWHASWGGAMRDVSHNPGYYSDTAWPGLSPSQGWNWGSTATSLPVIAGTVTIADLRSGHIEHALAMDIPDACANWFSWPAQRSDGTSTSADCLPEGAHLRIDPSLDIARLGLAAITRMLAEAAQRYGIIVRDISHHAIGFYAQEPNPGEANPYTGPEGFYDGLQPWSFLPAFPWSHLQLLETTPCSAAPCLPAAGS